MLADALEEAIRDELASKGGPETPDASTPARRHHFIDAEAKGPADELDEENEEGEDSAADQFITGRRRERHGRGGVSFKCIILMRVPTSRTDDSSLNAKADCSGACPQGLVVLLAYASLRSTGQPYAVVWHLVKSCVPIRTSGSHAQ